MQKFSSKIYHRRSIRLNGYDYSQSGAYFVTICTRNRELLLKHNEIKEIVERQWLWVEERYHYVILDEFVIMPNHIHGILIIMNGRDGSRIAHVANS